MKLQSRGCTEGRSRCLAGLPLRRPVKKQRGSTPSLFLHINGQYSKEKEGRQLKKSFPMLQVVLFGKSMEETIERK